MRGAAVLLLLPLLLLPGALAADDLQELRPFRHLNAQLLDLDTEQKLYRLAGLKRSTAYEVRVSFPASIPAKLSFEVLDGAAVRAAAEAAAKAAPAADAAAAAPAPAGSWKLWGRRARRRLLDCEKFVIESDAAGRVQGWSEPLVGLRAARRSVHRDGPSGGPSRLVFNIVLAELAYGLPADAAPAIAAVVLAVVAALLWSLYWSQRLFPQLVLWITAAPVNQSAPAVTAAGSKRSS